MELIRYRFPFHGFEWGATGYALSDQDWVRALAPLYGTSGITVLAVLGTATVVAVAFRPRRWWLLVFPTADFARLRRVVLVAGW